MKWDNTIAAKCRWGSLVHEVLSKALGENFEVIWEDSEHDYQGHARILAVRGDSMLEYGWSYGSCSGCDSWEDAPEEEVKKEIINGIGLFGRDAATEYASMLDLAAKSIQWNSDREKNLAKAKAIREWSRGKS